MLLLITITLPLFVVILAGYLIAWRGLIDAAGIRGLTGFVYYFALPLTLFHLYAQAPVEQFDGGYVAIILATGLAIHLTGLFSARWLFGCSWPEQSIQGIAVSFGNTVFIALPIVTGLFGEAATLPMLLAIAVENAMLMPFTVALLEIQKTGRVDLASAASGAARAILSNPIVLPLFPGAAIALLGWQLPTVVDESIGLIRGATVPCALFALGATLAGMPLTEKMRETVFMVAVKLFAYPALMFLALTVLAPDLDPVWRAVATISAATPMGANVYLIAVRYDAYVRRASAAVLFSTLCSIITVSALALLLSPATS